MGEMQRSIVSFRMKKSFVKRAARYEIAVLRSSPDNPAEIAIELPWLFSAYGLDWNVGHHPFGPA
jgi:hypothetical protein